MHSNNDNNLNQEDDTLLKKFFTAQLDNPIKGDWVSQVKIDLNELDLNFTFEEIKQCSKNAFKQIVKEKVLHQAFKYLIDLQGSHKKGRNIQFDKLALQEYLKSNQGLSIKEKSFIFAARSNMIDLKCNFKIGKTDLLCRGCNIEEECQQHILKCKALSDNSVADVIPEYDDLNSNNPKKIAIIGRILMEKFNAIVHRQSPSAAANVINTLVELE